MKEDDERRSGSVKSSSLGMPPCTAKKYPRRLKRISLGMPPVHPLLHQQSSVRPSPCYIFITSYVMCYAWSVSLFTFQFVLVLLAVHNKLDPSLHCSGEKHAPLHPRTQHRFSCLSFCVFFIFSQLRSCLALVFMLIILRAFVQVASGTLLSYHAYLVQRVGLLH